MTAVTPFICSAQSFEWSVSPMVFLDSEFTGGPEVGPGVSLGAALSPGGSVAYGLFLTLARTDFPVASDDFHRNFASAGVGLRLMTGGDGATIGIALGAWFVFCITQRVYRSERGCGCLADGRVGIFQHGF